MVEGLRNLDVGLVPLVTAPEIAEFWRENLRARFNARLGVQDVTEKSGFPLCSVSVLTNTTAPDPPRKRRRTGGSPPAGEQEVFAPPQIDDVDLQMNMETGNNGLWLVTIST